MPVVVRASSVRPHEVIAHAAHLGHLHSSEYAKWTVAPPSSLFIMIAGVPQEVHQAFVVVVVAAVVDKPMYFVRAIRGYILQTPMRLQFIGETGLSFERVATSIGKILLPRQQGAQFRRLPSPTSRATSSALLTFHCIPADICLYVLQPIS